MAFMFPIQDVLFGTYCLPKEPEPLEFGIGDGTDSRYNSFPALYLLPFIELLQPKEARPENPPGDDRRSDADPVTDADGLRPSVEPA